jgi:hypothetical protein
MHVRESIETPSRGPKPLGYSHFYILVSWFEFLRFLLLKCHAFHKQILNHIGRELLMAAKGRRGPQRAAGF